MAPIRPAPNWQKLIMVGSSAIVARRRYDTDPSALPMKLALCQVSISTRRKLASILLAVTIFALLAGLTSFATRGSIIYAIIDSILVGTGVGLFEQFYVQSLRGRWLRSMHPLLSITIYTAFVAVLFVVAVHLSHLLTGQLDTLSRAYRRLPFALPLVIAFSVIGIVVMRTVHFIGIETLFHLMIGTYHRPVIQEKVLLFLDINNSTGLAERLGAVQIKSLVGKFLFDISKPITDHGGEIYLYKGDGLMHCGIGTRPSEKAGSCGRSTRSSQQSSESNRSI
jgi:hypothetical protein